MGDRHDRPRIPGNASGWWIALFLASSACTSGVNKADDQVEAVAETEEASMQEEALLPTSELPPTPAPSGLRDVHLMEGPADGSERKFTRPHIPPFRTSADGRVAMQTRGGGFYLFAPEKLVGSFLGSFNGPEILASTTPVGAEVNLPAGLDAESHIALCDPGNNPRACGGDDCYSLVRIQPVANRVRGRTELWGTNIEVRVGAPKTAEAYIASVTVRASRRGVVWPGADTIRESTVTRDGRLFVARFGRPRNIRWRNDAGVLRTTNTEIYYSVAPEGNAACDVAAFSSPYPVSHAPYHRALLGRYGFAHYPMRDGEGVAIPDGADIDGTYPWIDPEGNNLFFTSLERDLFRELGARPLHDFAVRCVPGTDCTGGSVPRDLEPIQSGGDHLGVATVGLWTQGRTVLLDNMLNNTDFTLQAADGAHRLVRLYRENSGYVRVGTGRSNYPDRSSDPTRSVPPGGSGNITFIDSTANKFNHLPSMRVNVPRDVAWYISNGKATDVIAFDDWIDPHVLITSEMVQALGADRVRRATRIQNAAGTRLYLAPPYGAIVGRGRVEPVALGGVRGKGFYAAAGSGLRYDIPANQPRALSQRAWYLGMFVNPRVADDGVRRRLLELPDGSGIDLIGRSTISFTTPAGHSVDQRLRKVLPAEDYSHLGFRIQPGARRVEVFLDGMFEFNWQNTRGLALFRMGPGSLWLGRGASITRGVAGWYDDFKVIDDTATMSDEQICNHALGSLVGVGVDASSDIQADANSAPAAFHARVRAALPEGLAFERYVCFDRNRNRDGWVDLNQLPSGVTSVRAALDFPEGPLTAGAPRPDSSRNPFCLSCHVDDGTRFRPSSLLLDALTSRPGVMLEDDPRRQPSQPPPRIFGNIPASHFAPNLPSEPLSTEALGLGTDAFIHRR